MKFLITGAGGQLGREWSERLTSEGIPCAGLNSAEMDVTDPKAVSEALDHHKPDIVINCAAYTKVDEAEEEREKAGRINAKAVAQLAESCKQRGIKLVHYSTDYVFSGREEDKARFPEGYPEDHTTDPVNEYGRTKREGELAVIESGCDYLILRVSWLCGRYGNNFVKTMLRLAGERDELKVVNDQFGAPTFADNVVENTLALIQEDRSGIYHISSEGMCSWFDVAEEIFRLKDRKVKIHPVDSSAFRTKAKRPAFSKLSTQKISTISGAHIIHWKDGLKELLKESGYEDHRKQN